MKHVQLLALMLLTMPLFVTGQNLEVEGQAKITEEIASFQDTSFQMTEFKFTALDMKNNFGAYIAFTGEDGNNGGAEFARMEWLNASDGNEQSGKMKFYTADDSGDIKNAITIDNMQNVGIGTINPTSTLHVLGDNMNTPTTIENNATGLDPVLILKNSTGNRPALLFSENNTIQMGIEYDGIGAGTSNKMHILDFGQQRMVTFASTGNVGIDNTNPIAKLHVDGSVRVSNDDIYIEDINKGVIMKSPDGNCWRMTIDNAGGVVVTSIGCP